MRNVEVKLRRQIAQLNKDRLVGGPGGAKSSSVINAQFENELDHLVEENLKLEDEERQLLSKVKKLQARRREGLGAAAGGSTKNLYSVGVDKSSAALHETQLNQAYKIENEQRSNIQVLQTRINH